MDVEDHGELLVGGERWGSDVGEGAMLWPSYKDADASEALIPRGSSTLCVIEL